MAENQCKQTRFTLPGLRIHGGKHHAAADHSRGVAHEVEVGQRVEQMAGLNLQIIRQPRRPARHLARQNTAYRIGGACFRIRSQEQRAQAADLLFFPPHLAGQHLVGKGGGQGIVSQHIAQQVAEIKHFCAAAAQRSGKGVMFFRHARCPGNIFEQHIAQLARQQMFHLRAGAVQQHPPQAAGFAGNANLFAHRRPLLFRAVSGNASWPRPQPAATCRSWFSLDRGVAACPFLALHFFLTLYNYTNDYATTRRIRRARPGAANRACLWLFGML